MLMVVKMMALGQMVLGHNRSLKMEVEMTLIQVLDHRPQHRKGAVVRGVERESDAWERSLA